MDADKAAALRRHHALNPRPERVSDPAFRWGDPFFDRADLGDRPGRQLEGVGRQGSEGVRLDGLEERQR